MPSCTDGATPEGALVQDADGNLWGATNSGGTAAQGGDGTIFKIATDGSGFTTQHSFCPLSNCAGGSSAEGGSPLAGLIIGTDGNFYGTTASYGLHGGGTVFRFTPSSGMLTTVYSFGGVAGDGFEPWAPVMQASDGNFYGTTYKGGTQNVGIAFSVTPSGKEKVLHNFCQNNPKCRDGAYPMAGMVQGASGNLYGTSSGGVGTVALPGYYGAVYAIGVGLKKDATNTILQSSANPSLVNQTVTFTANVISFATAVPTRTVTFKEGSTTKTVSLLNGEATFNVTFTKAGTYSITATYSGDSGHLGSTSAVFKQVVNAE
jgi:uncharacterized repeat protein (TIGR03803 family)